MAETLLFARRMLKASGHSLAYVRSADSLEPALFCAGTGCNFLMSVSFPLNVRITCMFCKEIIIREGLHEHHSLGMSLDSFPRDGRTRPLGHALPLLAVLEYQQLQLVPPG